MLHLAERVEEKNSRRTASQCLIPLDTFVSDMLSLHFVAQCVACERLSFIYSSTARRTIQNAGRQIGTSIWAIEIQGYLKRHRTCPWKPNFSRKSTAETDNLLL